MLTQGKMLTPRGMLTMEGVITMRVMLTMKGCLHREELSYMLTEEGTCNSNIHTNSEDKARNTDEFSLDITCK